MKIDTPGYDLTGKLRQVLRKMFAVKPRKGTVSYGVVGYGNAGTEHARIVHDHSTANLTAVCDIDTEKKEHVLKRYKGINFYSSIDDMLSSEKLDVVSICTPHNTHCPLSIKSMENGAYVLCEKPMAISLDDAVRMIRAASENNAGLGIISQFRFEKAITLLKEEIDEGKLGDIISTSVRAKFYRTREYYEGTWKGDMETAGGGVLINQAIHMIDLAAWINGGISSVYSVSSSSRDYIDVEDNCVAVVNYSNGAFGTIDASTSVNPDIGMTIEVIGTRYSVVISGRDIKHWGGKSRNELESIRKDIRKVNDHEFHGRYFGYGHLQQIEDIVSCFMEKRTPVVSGEEGLETLRNVLSLMESPETGKVKIR